MSEIIRLTLEKTTKGWTVIEVAAPQYEMPFVAPEVSNVDEKPKRKLVNPRKSPILVDAKLVATVKFMLEKGSSRLDIMNLTNASSSTILKIERGDHDHKLNPS